MAEILNHPVNEIAPKTPSQSDADLANKLQSEFMATKGAFDKDVAKQGVIGHAYDWMKGHLGVSALHSKNMLTDIWSSALNYDNSSTAIRQKLHSTEEKLSQFSQDPTAESFARNLQKEILVGSDGKVALKIDSIAQTYDRSQNEGVNEIANAAVVAASLTKLGRANRFFVSAAAGASLKYGIKGIDGTYSTPVDDLLTGGVMGLSGHAARLGCETFKTGLRLESETGFLERHTNIPAALTGLRPLAALRTGMEFAPVGALAAATNSFTNSRFDGSSRFGATINGVEAAPLGAVEGFATGVIFGAISPRLPRHTDTPAPPSNPPSSGDLGRAVAPNPPLRTRPETAMSDPSKMPPSDFQTFNRPRPEPPTVPNRPVQPYEQLDADGLSPKVREAHNEARNPDTQSHRLDRLADHSFPSVRQGVAEHPNTHSWTLRRLSVDAHPDVRGAANNNPHIDSTDR